MRLIILFLVTTTLLFSDVSLYDQGKKLYFSKGCNGCHGVAAKGMSQYPPLAYRRKAFLLYKLKRLRAKQGDTQLSSMMIPFAMTLSDAQMEALATFLSEYHENSKGSYVPDYSMTGGGSS
jgi:cytochrome c553